MSTRSVFSMVSVALLVCACASTPSVPSAPPSTTPDGGGIGLRIQMRPIVGAPYEARTAYFVRVDEAGQPVDNVVQVSNYERDGRIYLLNAPLGRYQAVAAHFTSVGSTYLAYFSQAAVDATRAQVEPGRVVYAGTLSVDLGLFVCPGEADAAQLRHAEMIAPGVPKCGWFNTILHELATHPVVLMNNQAYTLGPSTYHYRGALRSATREAADRSEFLSKAKDDLQAAGWAVDAP